MARNKLQVEYDDAASARTCDRGTSVDDRVAPDSGNVLRGILYGLPVSLLLWGVIALLSKLFG